LIFSNQYKFLKRIIYSAAVLLILILQTYSEEYSSDTSFIRIIFAGDIMGHDAQILGAYNKETREYDYESTFRYLRPYIENADIAVGNLEVTFAGPPYKGYPRFSSPDDLAIKIESAGFHIMVNANNHALDRGKSGFVRTIDLLDSLNIIHTGTFRNKEERDINYPLIFEKNNIRIALLNYTYGTNSLKADTPCIVNIIDTALISQDLMKAELAEPDYIIVIMHWGIEYERQENKFQKDLARFMLEKGADAIIGSHPHVVQPVEILYPDEKDSAHFNIIVYSLGNFVSNQREQYRDGGIIFELLLTKSSSGTFINDYRYLPAWVYRENNKGNFTFYITPVKLYFENESFFNLSDHDKYKINRFYNDTKGLLKNIPESEFYDNYKIHPGEYLK
jgi:poly-gamma-glutamate capsule biosynthesis protein CapA/YwtB (metallophosphatase superfamily)